MSIPYSDHLNVLWDGGSNCSLITISKEICLGLKGTPVDLCIQKVVEDSKDSSIIKSVSYNIPLRGMNDRTINFQVYGVERISSQINHRNYEQLRRNGPIYYISYNEVLKSGSDSTPFRIVLYSSSNLNGYVLNNYWSKGPTLINNLIGILS